MSMRKVLPISLRRAVRGKSTYPSLLFAAFSVNLQRSLTTRHSMNNDPLLLDHEVDGIRELDNKLPRWWVWLFYFTIIFAAGYMGYYQVLALGQSSIADYT